MKSVIIAIYFGLCFGEPQCPRNSLPFDYQSCDPDKRSQCPSGFTCRKGSNPAEPDTTVYLCCESADMTVAEWFTEAMIAPQVFPQSPQQTLKTVQLTPLEPSTVFPKIHIGDEIVVLTYPNYVTGMVQSIEFNTPPAAGGYIHVMTVVDGGYDPFGVFFNYNLLSSGSSVVTVTGSQDAGAQFAVYLDNSTAVPKRDSYRAQYVVLVFRTSALISLGEAAGCTQTNGVSQCGGGDLMSGCGDVGCLLSNTTMGRTLGQPLTGTLFYLTTRRTMFPTAEGGIIDDQSISVNILPAIIVAIICILQ